METTNTNNKSEERTVYDSPVNAFKFNKESPYTYQQLCDSFFGQLYIKLDKGIKLSKSESYALFKSVRYNGSGTWVRFMGWSISFRKFMKTYVVKQYDRWVEYAALNKTMLRDNLCGRIQKIVEVK